MRPVYSSPRVFRYYWRHHPTGRMGWRERVFRDDLELFHEVAHWSAQRPDLWAYWVAPGGEGCRPATKEEIGQWACRAGVILSSASVLPRERPDERAK